MKVEIALRAQSRWVLLVPLVWYVKQSQTFIERSQFVCASFMRTVKTFFPQTAMQGSGKQRKTFLSSICLRVKESMKRKA